MRSSWWQWRKRARQCFYQPRWLILLVALALVHGALYAVIVPPWQSPDETGHFEYAWLLAHLRRVPKKDDVSPGFEGQLIESLYHWRFGDYTSRALPEERPKRLDELPLWIYARQARTVLEERFSLGYATQALAMLPLLHKGLETQLYAARLSSVLLNAWIVAAAYLTFRELFLREPGAALLAAAIVLLNPQHTFINATVGDGTLAEAGAALAIYGWARAFGRRFGALEALAIAAGTVIANLSKNSAVFLIAVDVVLATWWVGRRFRRGWRWRQAAPLIAMLLLLAGGLWVWRDSALGKRAIRWWGKLPGPANWAWVDAQGTEFGEALQVTHDSWWANFGWLNLPLSGRWYGAITGLSVAALLGWISGQEGKKVQQAVLWAPSMMVVVIIAALAAHIWVNLLAYPTGYSNFQGRYLFPAIVPWAYLLTGGWTRLVGERRGAAYLFLAGLVLLDAWAVVMYVVPYYYG